MIGTLCWICGGIGALAFATCSLPQVIKAIKTKSTKDISLFFIILSIVGNVFSAIYIFYTNYIMNYWQIPQYVNYGTALTLIVILMFLKIRYDKKDKKEEQIEITTPEPEPEEVVLPPEQSYFEVIEEEPKEEEPAVEEKIDENFELFKNKINTVNIPHFDEETLRKRTIYARQQVLNYRAAMLDEINTPIDEYRLTRPILNRWEIDYIKHALTNYDNVLNEIDKKFGKNETYKKIHNLILDKIVDTYPYLETACQQQKM
jgi:uncharacterized protein with PQ loop repeat